MNQASTFDENAYEQGQYYNSFPTPGETFSSFKFLNAQRSSTSSPIASPCNNQYYERFYQAPTTTATSSPYPSTTNDYCSPYSNSYASYSYPNDSSAFQQFNYQSPVQYSSYQPAATSKPHQPWLNGSSFCRSPGQYVNTSMESSGYQSQLAPNDNSDYKLISPNTLSKQICFDRLNSPTTSSPMIDCQPSNTAKAVPKRSLDDESDKENVYTAESGQEKKPGKRSRIEKLEVNVCYENRTTNEHHSINDSSSDHHLFPCQLCSAVLDSAAKLLMHIHKYHENGISNECPVCHKKFGNPANTLVHLRAHTQEKTYRCKMCPSAFCDSSTLKKHMRIHTGERPYVCPMCPKKFTQSGNLKRHLLVHQKYEHYSTENQQQLLEQPSSSASEPTCQDYYQFQPNETVNINFAQYTTETACFQPQQHLTSPVPLDGYNLF